MAWWTKLIELLRRSDSLSEKESRTLGDAIRAAVVGQAIDWLYFVLAAFTYFYFALIALLFFTKRGGYISVLTGVLDALSEPYLGTVGIYTVLKEIRKRRFGTESKHGGEFFVFLWSILLVVASLFVIFSKSYIFDEIAGLILTIGLAVFVIYLGAIIHKP